MSDYLKYKLPLISFCFALILGIFAVLPVKTTFAQQATLSLSPSTGTYNRGCSFSLQIQLNTGGAQTDGTDAILKFDPARLSATNITPGTIYSDYPGNNIDNSLGRVNISGLASITQAYSGQGTLATVNFTVKENAPTGSTIVAFDFDPQNKAKTTDSNVVERGTVADILNSVVDGTYTIGTGSCTSGSGSSGNGTGTGNSGTGTNTSANLPGGSSQSGFGSGATLVSTGSGFQTKDTLDQYVGGKTGTEQLTYTVAIIGATLTILGIIGLAIL